MWNIWLSEYYKNAHVINITIQKQIEDIKLIHRKLNN